MAKCIPQMLAKVLLLLCWASACVGAPPGRWQKEETVGLLKGLQPGAQDAADQPRLAKLRPRPAEEDAHQLRESQIAEPAKQPKRLPHKVIKRPAHLEGVPIERDGSLNKQLRAELVLGKDTNAEEVAVLNDRLDLVSSSDEPPPHKDDGDPTDALTAVFKKADADKSASLSKAEMESWIRRMTEHHLDEAVAETKKVFELADADGDERVTWDEYHVHFLVEGNLMSHHDAKSHKKEDHSRLDPQKRDEVEEDEEKWREAEQLRDGGGHLIEGNDVEEKETSPEGLTFQQFLGFRHPEHSDPMLTNMARDILSNMDKDGDGRISKAEWVVLPAGELEGDDAQGEEASYAKEREKEFDSAIDADEDGFVSVEELKVYSNPRNPGHAKAEVEELFELADQDGDHQLSLDEVLAQKGLFQGSGMLDPGRVIHHEL